MKLELHKSQKRTDRSEKKIVSNQATPAECAHQFWSVPVQLNDQNCKTMTNRDHHAE